jgi:arylsulfatase A-like enzyme
MDRQFGKLFDHLRSNAQLRDNTLLLICSDNGPEPGAGSAGPFRGSKTTLYEGGTRSPLIVWGPGLIDKTKAGSVNTKSIFAAFDLAPSLLSIAKIEAKDIAFDGENIAPALLGQNEVSRTAPIFWRRPPDRKTASPALPSACLTSPCVKETGSSSANTTAPCRSSTISRRIEARPPTSPSGLTHEMGNG